MLIQRRSQDILEGRLLFLIADRIHIGDVVRHDVELLLQRCQTNRRANDRMIQAANLLARLSLIRDRSRLQPSPGTGRTPGSLADSLHTTATQSSYLPLLVQRPRSNALCIPA